LLVVIYNYTSDERTHERQIHARPPFSDCGVTAVGCGLNGRVLGGRFLLEAGDIYLFHLVQAISPVFPYRYLRRNKGSSSGDKAAKA
jgi:hypothetical protein